MWKAGVREVFLILGEESPREVPVFLVDLPVPLRDIDLIPRDSRPEVPLLFLLALQRELKLSLSHPTSYLLIPRDDVPNLRD